MVAPMPSTDTPSAAAQPNEKWTCFHCGETFTDRKCATEHFGVWECDVPACQIKIEERGLVGMIRDLEAQLHAYRTETDEASTRYYARQADHARALRDEEQRGYDKGLRDGRALVVQSDDATVERVAIVLWHRFAPDYDLEWEDETHRAEYIHAARAAIAALDPKQ